MLRIYNIFKTRIVKQRAILSLHALYQSLGKETLTARLYFYFSHIKSNAFHIIFQIYWGSATYYLDVRREILVLRGLYYVKSTD